MKTLDQIVAFLKDAKPLFQERYGVTRIGIFGSLLNQDQSSVNDIDLVIEMEEKRKNIHNFLNFKRFLEKELHSKIDLGLEDSLKPLVLQAIKDKILYV